MPEIEFPEVEPEWVFERECVSFPALADGGVITCLATAELLHARFGARSVSPEDALRAFKDRRRNLEELAKAQILLGHVPPDGVLLLTSDTLALREVTYSEAVRLDRDFQLVKKATAYLSDLLGPSAVHASADWDRTEDKGRVFYTLRLHGLLMDTRAAIPREEIHRPSEVYVSLARLWGDILQSEAYRRVRELLQAAKSEA